MTTRNHAVDADDRGLIGPVKRDAVAILELGERRGERVDILSIEDRQPHRRES